MSSYEDQNNKIIELENKLKTQKLRYIRKIKELEDIYLLEISELNKKISMIKNEGYYNTINQNQRRRNTKKINSERKIKMDFNYDFVKISYIIISLMNLTIQIVLVK